MLQHLDTKQLADLAAENGVKIDKRWKRERIITTLEKAGVDAPETGDKLSDRVRQEPVRFIGGIGRIHVRNSKYVRDEGGDRDLVPGLVVDFMDANGEPVGGFSRPFYPDNPDHETSIECDCAQCLAEVRDFIERDKFGIVAAYHIREAGVNEPELPLTGWQNVNAADVADLHSKLGFDLTNAVRYELKNGQRNDVLDALNKIDEQGETVTDDDIANAELVI